jgi:hypothetical protein
MEYIDNIYNDYVLIRTNASTMFKLPLLKYYMENMNNSSLFASGTFTNVTYILSNVHYNVNLISGTNLCIPKKIVQKCISERQNIEYYGQIGLYEDVSLSLFILQQIPNVITYKMSRIDTLDNTIELQHCDNITTTDNLNNICCFRFKSQNRLSDISKMNELLDNNFNITTIMKWKNELNQIFNTS